MTWSKLFGSLSTRLKCSMKKTQCGFTCTRPWHSYSFTYSPGHPAVVSIIKEMRGAAKAYLEAIKSSVKVAGHGITFAADAVSLCERLSWHSGTDIQLFIDKMWKVACLAHDDAKNTFEAFGAVRHTLLQVCKLNVVSRVCWLRVLTGHASDSITDSADRGKTESCFILVDRDGCLIPLLY